MKEAKHTYRVQAKICSVGLVRGDAVPSRSITGLTARSEVAWDCGTFLTAVNLACNGNGGVING